MDSRLVVGISVAADAGEMQSVLVRVDGIGLDARPRCVAAACVPTFRLADRGAQVSGGGGAAPLDPAVTADHAMEAFAAVLDRGGAKMEDLLFAGLVVGEWRANNHESMVAARLAELTGLTVVTGYATRDWAAGGSGGPMGPLIDWMLASDQRFSRIMLHVDDVTRVTILPAATGPSRVRCFEAGPGMRLLDRLAAAFSHGRQPVDSRGMLAVQGRQIKPLIRRWATHSFLRQAPPKFVGPDDFAGPFIEETICMAADRGWSVADVLCTATHFVAACPADAVRQFALKDMAIEQVVMVGRGTRNGLLLRLLQEQFTEAGIATVTLPHLAREDQEALDAAMLGCLTLDGIPANLTSLTGATNSRLLGQLVPGSMRSWQQSLDWMNRAIKLVVPRAA